MVASLLSQTMYLLQERHKAVSDVDQDKETQD